MNILKGRLVGGGLSAWFELARPGNWITVPGDPIAGFLLASMGHSTLAWWRLVPAVAAVMLLYVAGMIWNDVADYEEDCRARPMRPLPRGSLSCRAAFRVGVVLALVALGLAVLAGWQVALTAVLLAVLVAGYDFGRRPASPVRRWAAYLNMGLCRGVSLLMGAAAAGPVPDWPQAVWWAALVLTLYIAAVTALAFGETGRPRLEAGVGVLLRGLLALQAAFCFFAGSFAVGGVLTGIWIGAMLVKNVKH